MFTIYGDRKSFYQWDLNQRLIVNTECTEVHFTNILSAEALVCLTYEFEGLTVVDVPNILLTEPLEIKAYVVVNDADNYRTDNSDSFEVIKRDKPSDYVYTETEVKRYESLEARIEELEKNGGGGSIDLTDYVTFDDVATSIKCGVVKVPTNHGLRVNNGLLFVDKATDMEIQNRSTDYKPIVPSQLDKAVKSGLAYCKEEWTEEEQAAARARLGAIGTTNEGNTTEPIVFESSNILYGWDGTYYGNVSLNPFTYDDIEDLVISYNIDFFGFKDYATLTYGNPSIEYYSFQEEFESCGMEWDGEFKVNIETSDWGTISICFGFDDISYTQSNDIYLTINDIYGAGESGDECFGMTLTIDKKGATKEVITIDRVKANDVVLTSPNGTNYTVTVDDSGKLTTAKA